MIYLVSWFLFSAVVVAIGNAFLDAQLARITRRYKLRRHYLKQFRFAVAYGAPDELLQRLSNHLDDVEKHQSAIEADLDQLEIRSIAYAIKEGKIDGNLTK